MLGKKILVSFAIFKIQFRLDPKFDKRLVWGDSTSLRRRLFCQAYTVNKFSVELSAYSLPSPKKNGMKRKFHFVLLKFDFYWISQKFYLQNFFQFLLSSEMFFVTVFSNIETQQYIRFSHVLSIFNIFNISNIFSKTEFQ